MSLKQKLLKTIATGLTLTALSGIPAYASHNDSKSNFENNTYEFGDVDEDGLTDMIVGNNSAVIYFRNAGNRRFEYKQKIYTPKNKEKPMITLVTINGKLNLIILTRSEFKTYRVNDKGRFEEYEFEPMWMDEDDEPDSNKFNNIKDAI